MRERNGEKFYSPTDRYSHTACFFRIASYLFGSSDSLYTKFYFNDFLTDFDIGKREKLRDFQENPRRLRHCCFRNVIKAF